VDPVEVPIHEGLTGIVGPNGCGKSNLLEALRWVMGASSARAMRGGEMDDLIFAGTAERPAREIAEVEMILDNSSRTAPAEFNDSDTIEVRRTLRRGAGSSYRINGRTVRARDVQILFADASTGANSPALVRQGQISELISSKPENRRRILEEAAGIGGLAARRHEAELKLKAADGNLEKLAEIMAEIERQANALRRQAGKARRYRALSDEIAALEARLSAARWRQATTEHGAAKAEFANAKLAESETVSVVARASAAELDARSLLDPLRAAETESAGRLGVLRLQQARLETERDGAREALRRTERERERLQQEETRLAAELADARQRATRAKSDLAALPEDSATSRKAIEDALAAKLTDARTRLREVEADADAKRAAFARAEADAASAARQIAGEEARVTRLDAELSRLRTDLSQLGDPEAPRARLAEAQTRWQAADAAAQEIQAAFAAANREVDAARAEEQRLTPPLHAAEKRVRELEAELAGLDRLIRQTVASDAPPVIDRVKAQGLERALAAALGSDLESSEDSDAASYWSGRAAHDLPPLPIGAKPLSEIASAPPALSVVFTQIGLVDSHEGERLQSGLQVGQSLVSIEGDLWRWDGFVRKSEAPLPAAETFAHRTRRTVCAAELARARNTLADADAAKSAASSKLTQAELQLIGLRRRSPDLTRSAQQAREAVMRAEQDVERLQIRRSGAEASIARLAPERDAAAETLKLARAQSSRGPLQEERDALVALQARIAALRDEERTAAADLDGVRREHERAVKVRESLTQDLADWSRRAQHLSERLDLIRREVAEAGKAIEASQADAQTRQQALEALAQQVEAADSHRKAASDTLAGADRALREAEAASRQARDASAQARERLVRAEARLEAAARREAEIEETVRAAFQRDLEDLEQLVASASEASEESANVTGDPGALEARLAQLRRDRDGLGAVNMEADEQLAEISGRMGLQVEEHADLVAAIARLREGVEALNEEGRARLLEAFESVNAHFKSLFTALFAGGEAELRLTDAPDPLDAGLEIYASPPGKRMGALSLMSGGEQALTATALIFAVFLTRPAPICVLDEVDAPLDDANVDRFCRLLDEMRRRTATRFTVITHNAVSMSRMDRLFGVTMQERGVSRLVSVDLQAAERLAAA
jgi:chromosome segregation protein